MRVGVLARFVPGGYQSGRVDDRWEADGVLISIEEWT